MSYTCVDCGFTTDDIKEITYREQGYVCPPCWDKFAWWKWGRSVFFFRRLDYHLLDGLDPAMALKEAAREYAFVFHFDDARLPADRAEQIEGARWTEMSGD